MKFVYPGFLWTLLALLIPLIIHLYNFKKYKTVYFSSLAFLKTVDQQTKSTQRLKHILILISRILAFTFIILAFAQPYLNSDSSKTKGGNPVILIHIDNSFSMSMRGTEGELLSEAKEAVRTLVNKSSYNTKFILSTNALSGIEEKTISKLDALDRIDHIDFSPISRSAAEVLNWQEQSVARGIKTGSIKGNNQCLMFSDFQDFTLSSTDEIKNLSNKHIFVKLEAQEKNNIYIDSVWFSSPFTKVGISNQLFIRVVNSGDEDLRNLELTFNLSGKNRNLFIDIDGNSSKITSVHYTDHKPGSKLGMVSVSDKQFFADDDFYFSYTVEKESNVLICDGEDAIPEIKEVYQLDDFYNSQSIHQSSIVNDLLDNQNLLILNGINEISTGFINDIVGFCNNDGALVIIPGKNIDKNSLNQLLQELNLPVFLRPIQQKNKLQKLNLEDPFFTGIFSTKNEKPGLPGTNSHYSLQSTNSTDAFDLIHFANGNPFLIRSNNSSRIYLFTSVIGKENGTILNDALFPTLFLRFGEVSNKRLPLYSIIGNNEVIRLPIKSDEGNQLHLKLNNYDVIPQQRSKRNLTEIYLSDLTDLKSGNYKLESASDQRFLALNYNRNESDVRSEKFDQFLEQLKVKGYDNVEGLDLQQSFGKENIELNKPTEYWKWCLILALLFILVEIALILFWNPIIKR